jgi:gas vesicle protein
LFDSLPADIVDVVDEDLIEDLETTAERFKELREKRRDREREIREEKDDAMRELREEFGDKRGSEAYYRRMEEIREKYESMDSLPEDEQAELEALREQLSENSKRVSDTVENEVRQAVGHFEKGDRWTSETILYQLIESRYGDEYTIERHHRPKWLDGLELDIFIVETGVGVEYQGVQHYEAVEHWGGEEALEERQERDARTKELCRERGVDVVEVRHDEELSEELVRRKIDSVL